MRHWFTFCVDFKYRAFIFLDSLYNKDDDFHTSIKKRLINNFTKLWKLIFNSEDNIFRNFGVLYANVPKQNNPDDCGVFTMKFMEVFKPDLDMRRFFSTVDIVNIRIHLANKLYFCPRNQADKSLVLNYATPDYVSSKAAELGTFNTAPAIEPMVKVRSRLPQLLPEEQGFPLLNTYPAGVKDTRSSLYMSSPISRINFSPNLSTKDPKAPCTSKVGNLSKHQFGRILNVNGSKGAPIPVADCSLKPQLIVQTPEVQITGASSFSFRQAELAKKGDELYNSVVLLGKKGSKSDNNKSEDNFIDLSQHAFEDRIVKDNLVILQPKNSLVLPLVQNGRFPVSDLDIKNYCAIVDLAYTQGIQKSYAVKYPKVHCSYISLGQSLMVSGHVDNFLIPVFCRKLFEDNHPSKSGRHHFFSLVGECILEYENDEHYSFVSKAFLGASSASKGKRLELSDRLFFPICRMRHWFTFCVDFKYRAFIFLDSLYNKDDDFHTSIKKRLKFWSPFMPMSLSKTILMTVVFSQ
uniref:Uncharacterized protein n=1 Tax=Avena sativa TaxID=4498 RepID=A0ACD5WM16_AVESA